jgi:multimeric flavodoxin WrbA
VKPAVFACSPRAGGNSDTAAALFAKGVREAGGDVDVIVLRKWDVHPCIGCRKCESDPEGRCCFDDKDRAPDLFAYLLHAPFVCFASPIHFYHVPAGFKAFIDRSQSYYIRRERGDERLLSLPERPAYLAMVAGQPRGKRLFEGSLLTLKYFLVNFNLTLSERALLRGIDAPGDLEKSQEASAEVVRLGRLAWERHAADADKG